MRREPLTGNMGEALSLTNLSTKRQRIAELARMERGVALSTLHHVIDLEWMQEASRRPGQATCAVWADASSRQDALRRLPQHPTRWEDPSGDGWDRVQLPRLYRIVHGYTTMARLSHEEPDAGNLHIRICEG